MQHLHQRLRELTEQHAHQLRMVAASADEVARAGRVLHQAERTHARARATCDDLQSEIGTLRRELETVRHCNGIA